MAARKDGPAWHALLFRFLAPLWLVTRLCVRTVEQPMRRALGPTVGHIEYLVGGALTAFLILFLCALALGIFLFHHPRPAYFFVEASQETSTPVITALQATQQPGASGERARWWVNRALKDTLSFNFLNMEDRLTSSRHYFDSDGALALEYALARSKLRDVVTRDRLEMIWTPVTDPIVVAYEAWGERGIWKIEIPALLIFKGAQKTVVQSHIYEIVVMEVPSTVSPEGLVITRILAQQQDVLR